MQFKTGDVVQLKSGGPRMSVDRIDAEKMVHCSWFDQTDRKTGVFHPETLKASGELGPVRVYRG